MKRIGMGALALVTVIGACGLALIVRAGLAQIPKVNKIEGHLSPLSAMVTFPDGTTRQYLILGRGNTDYIDNTHQFTGGSDAGDVKIWLDTIKTIKNTDEQEATLVLKDGTERTLSMKGYNGGGTFTCANSDGSREAVQCAKVKKIEFLKPARKDKKGNAMFDQWLYSPFTDEKLEEE